jgi:hypothetical protein
MATIKALGQLNLTVKLTDFLTHDFGAERFDFVVGNPPWSDGKGTVFWKKFVLAGQKLLSADGRLLFLLPDNDAKRFPGYMPSLGNISFVGLRGTKGGLVSIGPSEALPGVNREPVPDSLWGIQIATWKLNQSLDEPVLILAQHRRMLGGNQPLWGQVTSRREIIENGSYTTGKILITGGAATLQSIANQLNHPESISLYNKIMREDDKRRKAGTAALSLAGAQKFLNQLHPDYQK